MNTLVRTWQALGKDGPTLGSAEAGDPLTASQSYLLPLARVLVGGLAGSTDHSAVYYDERYRYADPDLTREEQQERFREALSREISSVAQAFEDQLSPQQTREILWHFHAPLLEKQETALSVLLIGDCLFVETRAFLNPLAQRLGCPVDIRHVFFSATQRRADANEAITNEIQRFKPDLIGISLFTFEGVPPYRAAWQEAANPWSAHKSTAAVDGLIDLLQTTVNDIRTVSDATLLVHSPGGVPLDRMRRRVTFLPAHSRGQRRLLEGLQRGVHELADSTPNTVPLDESAIIERDGGARAVSGSLFPVSDVPTGYFHTTRLGPNLAHAYGDILSDYQMLGRAKAVFVDFDNTLWQGVMAEGPVEHFLERQALLRQLREAGILLVALSKNDPASIRWSEMVLSEEDFAVLKINWQPKPDNVSSAIAELDLDPSAFVLLDDNPVELALVTESIPAVRGLDSHEPASWRALRHWLEFPSTAETAEARERTTMYREAASRRRAMGTTHDYEAMMLTLKLRNAVWEAEHKDLDRLLELVQRTNQFNTTTRRLTRLELEALVADCGYGVYVASLKDKFGNLGIVGVAMFDRRTRTFDAVIMSCRAMGFGLELALLSAVVEREGEGPLAGRFVPTSRNTPAADLFQRAGFKADADDDMTWRLQPIAKLAQAPSWFR